MTGQLLETKLFAPKLRRGLVPRPSLIDRLIQGTESKLTLISAPAGFGKSTLLAQWLATPTDGSVIAWLSLDRGDDQPTAFWTQVIAALQTARPGLGTTSLALLDSPDRPIEAVLAPLLNELNALPVDIVLVLDDYHLVEGGEIQLGMEFLLEHLPPRVRIVIATRADPGLRLGRLRARGELLEVRAADLRFRPDEAATYLNGVMDLGLSAAQVAALETRTEGWIAALQLAGLSMQGREDVGSFIAGFAGDDRYIVDYLVEEVLHRQPDHLRTFLLDTSILARMTGPLCDAIVGGVGGSATLEALDRGNLFLVALDDRRQWYRYHHLFGDVLQAHLLAADPGRAAELHRRASRWLEAAGDRPEAIRHALAGEDFAVAADLVELAMPTTLRDRQEAILRRWLEALPDDVLRSRPVLSDGYAGTILTTSQTAGVESRLRDAERWLEGAAAGADGGSGPRSSMVVVDQKAFRRLPGSIAIHRAGLARLLGDVPGSIVHARRALDLLDDDEDVGRGSASALLGLASWTNADLEEASALYTAAIPRFETAGFLSDVVGLSVALADMRLAQGRLYDALRIYERGLELATSRGPVVLRGAVDMLVGISDIQRERGDLIGAAQHLQRAADLGEGNGLPQHPYRGRVVAARLRQAQGDLDGAIDLLKEARQRYVTDFSPPVRPVSADLARMWIARGDLAEAWTWAREERLSPDDEISYVREYEHATLARLMLAQAIRDRASVPGDLFVLIKGLLAMAEGGGRTGSVIDVLIILALAHHAMGARVAAVSAITRAIVLAEPEGYVRVFADAGPPIMSLLKLAARRPDGPAGARHLLAAMAAEGHAPVDRSLVEPLSEREREVLWLLDTDLDGPEIARELVVSLATIRTHTRNVYAKLGVNSRREAVRRAAELGLLTRSERRPPTA